MLIRRANAHTCANTHTDELQKQPPWETVNSPNHRVHERVRGVMGKQDACMQCHRGSRLGQS